MGQIIITTEPNELVLDGTTVLMQGDPSGGKAWSRLLDLKVAYTTPEERDKVFNELLDALAEMTLDDDQAELFRAQFSDATRGIVTLRKIATAYIEAVTGFPTQPVPRSKTR